MSRSLSALLVTALALAPLAAAAKTHPHDTLAKPSNGSVKITPPKSRPAPVSAALATQPRPHFYAAAKVGRQTLMISTGTPVAGVYGWQMLLDGKPLAILPPGHRGWGVATAYLPPKALSKVPSFAALGSCKASTPATGMVEATLTALHYSPRVAFIGEVVFKGRTTATVEGQGITLKTTTVIPINYAVWTNPAGDFTIVRSLGKVGTIAGCLYLRGSGWVDQYTPPPATTVKDNGI